MGRKNLPSESVRLELLAGGPVNQEHFEVAGRRELSGKQNSELSLGLADESVSAPE
jgi:hypothetical protein